MTDETQTETREFDLPELLKGSVESVTDKLVDLNDDELATLHELEGKGAKRVTMLDAIHREQAKRAEQGGSVSELDGQVLAAMAADPNYPLGEADAMKWAVAWRLTRDQQRIDVGALPASELDGWMVGWFANAMASAAPTALMQRDGGAAGFTQADIDAAVEKVLAERAGQQGATISASEHMRLMAEKDTAHANALAAAKAEAANKPAPKPKPAPGAKRMAIDAKADAPGLVALTGATKVQFVDDRDMTLLHLPVLDFVPAQFVPMGEAVKLTVDIEFPTTLTGSEVAGAFLLDDSGKAVAKAVLVAPVKVGGGRNVKLPSGTLMFEKPAAAAPAKVMA